MSGIIAMERLLHPENCQVVIHAVNILHALKPPTPLLSRCHDYFDQSQNTDRLV
jgi:hypothetical protein